MEDNKVPDFMPESLPEGGPQELPADTNALHDKRTLEAMLRHLRESGAPEEVIKRVEEGQGRLGAFKLDKGLPSMPELRGMAIMALHTTMSVHLKEHGIDALRELNKASKGALKPGMELIGELHGLAKELIQRICSGALEKCDGDVSQALALSAGLMEGLEKAIHDEVGCRQMEFFSSIILKKARGQAGAMWGPEMLEHFIKGLEHGSVLPDDVKEALRKLL